MRSRLVGLALTPGSPHPTHAAPFEDGPATATARHGTARHGMRSAARSVGLRCAAHPRVRVRLPEALSHRTRCGGFVGLRKTELCTELPALHAARRTRLRSPRPASVQQLVRGADSGASNQVRRPTDRPCGGDSEPFDTEEVSAGTLDLGLAEAVVMPSARYHRAPRSLTTIRRRPCERAEFGQRLGRALWGGDRLRARVAGLRSVRRK